MTFNPEQIDELGIISYNDAKALRVVKRARIGLIQQITDQPTQDSYLILALTTANQDDTDEQETILGLNQDVVDELVGTVFHVYTDNLHDAELLAATFGNAIKILNGNIDD